MALVICYNVVHRFSLHCSYIKVKVLGQYFKPHVFPLFLFPLTCLFAFKLTTLNYLKKHLIFLISHRAYHTHFKGHLPSIKDTFLLICLCFTWTNATDSTSYDAVLYLSIFMDWARGYKIFFMLNSVEHKLFLLIIVGIIKPFSCSTQLSIKFFLLIIVGILPFVSGKNRNLGLSEPAKSYIS